MPAVSQKQFRFFKLLGHNPELAKEHGFTAPKAEEMTQANIGKMSYADLPVQKKDPQNPTVGRWGKLIK